VYAPRAPAQPRRDGATRAVRFTSLMDDGDRTRWRDIALAKVLVE